MDITTTGLRELHLYAQDKEKLLHYINARADKLEHGDEFSIAVHCKEQAGNHCVVHMRLFADGKLVATSAAASYDAHLALRNAFNALERQLTYYNATKQLEERSALSI